jgi:hypothetical protein
LPALIERGNVGDMLDRFDPDYYVLRADVHLLGIEPKISRTLELPMALNLAQLHDVLQAAFGWADTHLHEFIIGGLVYGAPELDEGFTERRTFEATGVRMADLRFPNDPNDDSLTILYDYDFGDNWQHVIRLERVPSEEGVKYPRCIDASRSGPPEDSGGPWSYGDFVEAWSDPAHEEHKDIRRWAGRKFHPERCDLDEINKAITKAVRLSKGGYRFRQHH